MDDKLFIIAIGGTGMRCLESFVHLCAAGLFDNKTIDVLTLDTDQTNGNKGRVEQLVELYNKVKTNDSSTKGGEARANTFFSAKLNLYKFFTDYSQANRKNFKVLTQTRNLTEEQRQNDRDLADLFFDPETVQDFPLDHGYRAQTHLGSLLMYHGIMEAAIKAKEGSDDVQPHERELMDFLQLINQNAGNSRVFVFGSIFGGTGASSIPIIPIALRDALKVITDGNNDLDLSKVRFGSTLLTDYFKFDVPEGSQREKDKVIADSNNFALNSQTALTFYNNDLTVKNSYKLLYHIGWPSSQKTDYSEGQSGEVITGGDKQKNQCHVVELMSAAAAYDFFTRPELDQRQAEYVYRAVELNDVGQLKLSGNSFVGEESGRLFEQKLGNLLSLAHLILSKHGGAKENVNGTREFLETLKRGNVDTFANITDEQANQLDEYLKSYAYKISNGKLMPGWLHQVFKSVGQGEFIFNPQALSTSAADLQNVDPGSIYNDDRFNWNTSFSLTGSKADKRVSKFIDVLKDEDKNVTPIQGVTLKEKFIACLYNSIAKTQKKTELGVG